MKNATLINEFMKLWVIISMMVTRDASDVMGYDSRTPELSNAPLHMKQDTNSIEL